MHINQRPLWGGSLLSFGVQALDNLLLLFRFPIAPCFGIGIFEQPAILEIMRIETDGQLVLIDRLYIPTLLGIVSG